MAESREGEEMGGAARIVRARKDREHPYKPVLQASFDGCGLSFEARGLLAYLLMKPDTWEVQIEDVMREGKIGRHKAYRLVGELIAAGFAVRVDGRGEEGRFEVGTIRIIEGPVGRKVEAEAACGEKQETEDGDVVCVEVVNMERGSGDGEPCAQNPHADKPDTDKPDTDKPYAEKPYAENQHHSNKGNTTKKGLVVMRETAGSHAAAAVDANLARIWQVWETNMPGTKSPLMTEAVTALLQEYSPAEIEEAITIACHRNRRTLDYVRGILRRGAFAEAPPASQHAALTRTIPTSKVAASLDAVDAFFARLEAQQEVVRG